MIATAPSHVNAFHEAKREILTRLGPQVIARELQSAGLRIAGDPSDPSSSGYVKAHGMGRADRNASAGFNVDTGHYKDHGGEGESLGFFDFMVKYGEHADFTSALRHYADLTGVALPQSQSRKRRDADIVPDDCREQRRANREAELRNAPRCSNPFFISKISKDGHLRGIGVRCSKWACPGCATILRGRWIDHFRETLPNYDTLIAQGKPYGWLSGVDYLRCKIDNTQWPALRKRLGRILDCFKDYAFNDRVMEKAGRLSKGPSESNYSEMPEPRYVRLKHNDGTSTVWIFVWGINPGFDHKFRRTFNAEGFAAEETSTFIAMVEDIESVGGRIGEKRCVSVSENWRLPKEEQPEPEGEFLRTHPGARAKDFEQAAEKYELTSFREVPNTDRFPNIFAGVKVMLPKVKHNGKKWEREDTLAFLDVVDQIVRERQSRAVPRPNVPASGYREKAIPASCDISEAELAELWATV